MRTSFDFENAVNVNGIIFGLFLNYALEDDDDADEGGVPLAALPGQVVASGAIEALSLYMDNARVVCDVTVATDIVRMHESGALVRPSDEAVAPACVVVDLLSRLGHRKLACTLQPLSPSADFLRSELDGFGVWFSAAMANRPATRGCRTKQGSNKRVRLRRGDQHAPRRARGAALGAEWTAAKENQKRDIVVNALLASFEAKRYVTLTFGAGATSLGSTGVERGWWFAHTRNTNKTAVWATNASRQYRAVVVWKDRGLIRAAGAGV